MTTPRLAALACLALPVLGCVEPTPIEVVDPERSSADGEDPSPASSTSQGGDGASSGGAGPGSDDSGSDTDGDSGSSQATTGGGSEPAAGSQGGFGTDTRGGLDGDIYVVTTLDDSGPGSLREAVQASGPRLVVFEVGGVIQLEDDLGISNPEITIAGQTAPSPGVSLHHGRVSIRTHDVVLEHLRLRPGDRHANGSLVSGELADNRDAILIGTSARDTHHIVLDNVSLSWSIDETISVWYGRTADITIRDSIIGEPLSVSLHPKSDDGQTSHGYCLLFGDDTVRASVIGNVFAHCTRRVPWVGSGNEIVMLDNVIYNSIETAMNAQGAYPDDSYATVIGNVFKPGAQTKDSTALLLSKHNGPGSLSVYFENNTLLNGHALTSGSTAVTELSDKPVWDDTHDPGVPGLVLDHALSRAGARPRDRDEVDTRIIEQVENGSGTRINFTDDVGGYPELEQTHRPLDDLPQNPTGDDNADGVTNVEDWLAHYRNQVE